MNQFKTAFIKRRKLLFSFPLKKGLISLNYSEININEIRRCKKVYDIVSHAVAVKCNSSTAELIFLKMAVNGKVSVRMARFG